MRVSLIEYGVRNYPPGLENFRFYRIEYGGHAEACIQEAHVWLPKDLDPRVIEVLLEGFDE